MAQHIKKASAGELHLVAVPLRALPLHQDVLGRGHMQRLLDMGSNGNAFICTPIPTKEMWDGVQSAHIKTLSCCFVIESASKRANVPILFRDMIEEVMESGPVNMPLHL